MSRDHRRLALIAAAAVAVLAVVVVLVVSVSGSGDDASSPARPAADPLAFVPAGADAVFDLDLRVPVVALLFTQLVRQDAGDAAARLQFGDRAAIAIQGTRRTLVAQLASGDQRAVGAVSGPRSPGNTAVGARDGVVVVAPDRAALAVALHAAPTTARTAQAARAARNAFERRLARLPRRSGARVAFDPRALLTRFGAGQARTAWARALRDGAAAIVVRGSRIVVPFRVTSAPVALGDLPVAPGTSAPPAHGTAPIVAALRDPGQTLDYARDAGLFDGLGVIDRLPGFLRPDLHQLGRDGTLTTADRRTVIVRVTPRDARDWSKKLNRLDALSGLARRLGIADVRIDRQGDAYRIDQHGSFALRVGVFGRTLVLTNSQTADLRAAADAPAQAAPAGAAGALTIDVAPDVIYDELDRRFDTTVPRTLLTLSPLTGWLRAEPRVTAGELRIGVSR